VDSLNTMAIPFVTQIKNINGKRILVRVDFNVPIKNGKVMDDTRLTASLPTIQYLQKKKAQVIIVTHIGRPMGKMVKSLRVAPVAKRLGVLLDCHIVTLSEWETEKGKRELAKLKPGEVIMLENIRFSKGEEENNPVFAKRLASLADIFVLDGFAVSHRPSASVSGLASYLPSYSGLLLAKEIQGLNRVLKKPKPPFVLMLGGIKIEIKLPVIKNLLPIVDTLLLGGALVSTFLWAAGYGVGRSIINTKYKKEALQYAKNKKVILPVDLVVGDVKGKKYRVVLIEKKPHVICKKDEAIFDIGPETIRLYSSFIKKAKTLLWNGALGYFEQSPYDIGTSTLAWLIGTRSKGKVFGVIGGGETLQAMASIGMLQDIDFVSTGGGAMLAYLAGKKLPGIVALKKRDQKKKM